MTNDPSPDLPEPVDLPDPSEPSKGPDDSRHPAKGARRFGTAIAQGARRLDHSPALINTVRRLRDHLPGDRNFGDPLSVADRRHFAVAQQHLASISGAEDGVLNEISGGALQVWQAVLGARGRDTGEVDVTLLFTDLVGFSSWALSAGDEEALGMLRTVGSALEPPVAGYGGQVVKRLGDGMMAAFRDPRAGLAALVEGRSRLSDVRATDGWRPKLRAGLHTGRPRRLGGDFLGVDVNIAARLVERAGPDEILASGPTVAGLDPDAARWRRKKTFALLRVKGVPGELDVYAVTPR